MQVTDKCPITESYLFEFNDNPRGGMRGVRGAAIKDGKTFIANYSSVKVYNKEWELIKVIKHPSCAGIHDILIKDENLWVTSTRNDLLFQFDFDGNINDYFNYREDKKLVSKLGLKASNLLERNTIISGEIDFRDPRTHNVRRYNRAQLNSLCVLPNGDLLILLGCLYSDRMAFLLNFKDYLMRSGLWPNILKITNGLGSRFNLKKHPRNELLGFPSTYSSAIIRFHKDGSWSVPLIIPKIDLPIHSLLPLKDGTVTFNNTSSGELVHFDPESGDILSKTFVDQKFLRGLEQVTKKLFITGSQNCLYLVDIEEGVVRNKLCLTEDDRASIFAIKKLLGKVGRLPSKLS
jgi:hypothetical protein